MSRTYRKWLDHRYVAYGRMWTWQEKDAYGESLCSPGDPWWAKWEHTHGWSGTYIIDRRARDRKPWNKPSKEFKQMNRRKERAQVRNAMRTGREIPFFKKTDQWDWT